MRGNRGDELGRLAQAVNRLATRLAGFVTGQKRFLGNVAHEFCSPLARLQMALGILEERVEGRQRSYVDDLRAEAQEMSQLVNELLSFSKAGLKPDEIKIMPVAAGNLTAARKRVFSRLSGSFGVAGKFLDRRRAEFQNMEPLIPFCGT